MQAEQVSNQPAQRLRLRFGKTGPTRFISHLDLARALERSLNRAGIPVAYSQGFNRRPRLSLAAALPLGYSSEAELADIWLTQVCPPETILARLQEKTAPGVILYSVTEISLNAPSLQQTTAEAEYRVRFLDDVDGEALRRGLSDMLSAETLPYERGREGKGRARRYDLRPLILDLSVETGPEGRPIAHMRLRHTANEIGRPDDVLAALGFDPLNARVHRVRLRLASDID